MKSNSKSRGISRRDMMKNASIAAVGASMLSSSPAAAQVPQQNYQSGKDPGKHEPLEDFKFDLESTKGWVGEAGSAKEATVSEFPASKNIAGVSMRLQPGGIRELHWHAIAAEWAYMITGNVRTTVISPNGQAATDEFGPGDIWYFPKGHGHALQNIGNTETHFILGFDDGHFSEFGTFSITDWIARTPVNLASRNLFLSADTISAMPKKEMYILPGKIPARGPEPYLADNIETPQSPHKFASAPCPRRNFPAAGSESSPRKNSRSIPLSPPSCSISNPARFVKCTGIPMPTNGSTTSAAIRASRFSARTAAPRPKNSVPAKSVLSSRVLATTWNK